MTLPKTQIRAMTVSGTAIISDLVRSVVVRSFTVWMVAIMPPGLTVTPSCVPTSG